ncbi:PrsW family intramembrane metalloprotease [Lysinibacter cavernae]|uniref:RsiW-degrading membrane proteinase PrsW (M82 family) n=1 Tax=Lysinibacter cavernae TaxID=1640652 RepID=A0A7X5R1D0_9MICO|nr:PrsW family intramembrane metalloprotease [Lysinibacter cavernae]NIH53570.1 RsiW-degrading membrane proteinase PrsW (M82 family) [Lysinibacter cavernae]
MTSPLLHEQRINAPANQVVFLQPTGYAQPAVKKNAGFVVAIIALVLLAFIFIAVVAFMMSFLGSGAVIGCSLVALIPLTVVLLTAAWVDRWEPEPRLALAFAFLWGAGMSVLLSLLVDTAVQVSLMVTGATGSEVMSTVVQAPLVEEASKGAGLLLVLLVWRKTFDGVVDGLVYAMVIAAGFAFTENILYFGDALATSGSMGLTETFVLRGILSPFAHAMFTACTGFALGFAVSRGGGYRIPTYFVVGLAGAISLHALWNGSTYVNFFALYALVQVPMFSLCIWFVFIVRRQERLLTERRLMEYAAAGWFSPGEVHMLATKKGRAGAKRWAKLQDEPHRRAMQALLSQSTRLAYTRQRIVTGHDRAGSIALEAELLRSTAELRRFLSGDFR